MKKGLWIILGIVVVLGCIVFVLFQKQIQDVEDLKYSNIVMNDVDDGNYEGDVETMLIKVKVNVTVNDHRIQQIDILKHDNGFGAPAEDMIESMIQNNDYQVDIISGATYSSEVIKNAVNQALQKGVHKNG